MKLNTLPVKFVSICALLLLFAFIPKGDDPIDKLVAALQKWTDTSPQEKVYLQMDKPYYALGDTIWFKGYVTIGSRHQLSALSGSLYVDFLSEKDSVVRSLKLPVTSGMVVGEFALGDDLNEGSYRIRAYTQWMRNAGEDYYFDKTFTVGSVVSNNVVAKISYKFKDPTLTAVLNYTDDQGKALADHDVRYQIIIDKKAVYSKTTKTDALGSLAINITNDKKVNLSGAYIRAVLEGSDKQQVVKEFAIKADLTQTDVQFFPEGGELVNGVSSRVAFKAVGIDGAGAAITGKVVDNANTEVGDIETLHAGMGSFLIRPEAGKTYSAKVSFADGTTKTIALPKPVDDGFALGVYQPNKDSIMVKISTSAKTVATAPTVNLIAHVNGEVIIASPVKIGRASTILWLEKKLFPTGVAQFTLFNNAGEPINERVAFVKSNDLMKLSLTTAKTSYKSKEPVKIQMDAKDSKANGVAGNFSVSVIDESKVPSDETAESTIFTNLLLTSDLKGYIEKPNYYFINDTEEADNALDNLMMTQGYRRFAWKDITTATPAKPVFAAEGLTTKISGTVQTLGHKLLPNATVNLVSMRAKIAKATTTDANGRFVFDGILLLDSIKFAIQARTPSNSDRTIITLDTIPRMRLGKNRNLADVSTNINATLKEYIENGKKLDDIYEKSGQLDRVQRLREVRINARRVKEDANITPQGMFRIPDQSADKIITFPEASSCVNLSMCLQARLQGIRVESVQGYSTLKFFGGGLQDQTVGVILDGRRITNPDEVSEILEGSIQPEDVAKIAVVVTNQAQVSVLGGPSILIYTKLGTTRKQYNPSIANISPKGFNKVREFYSPKYDAPASAKLPDLRSTIFWDPRVKTDATGKTSIDYFNADGPGNYKVVVEGINAAGELGRQVYRYTVQ